MRFGSLFSGIGGFDLGLERAGMQCAWQLEIDPKCQALLKAKWPGVEQHGDIREITAGHLAGVDVISGGFPCQDVSVAGRRKGLAGERSGLWFEFHRILAGLRPNWCLIENVPGLLSSNRGRDFAVILRGLVGLGYGVAWRVLDAQYFGVAQRRERVFIVGHLGDGRAAEVLLESESMSGHPPPSRETGQGTARSLAPSLAASGRGTARVGESRGQDPLVVGPVVPNAGPRSHDAGNFHSNQGVDAGHIIVAAMAGTVTGAEAHNGNSNPIPDNLILAGPIAGGAYGSGRRSEDDPNVVFGWHGAQVTSKENRGGVYPNQAPTLNSDPRAMVGVRRLTPTECERLQGFPDGWTSTFSDSVRYRMLGNAVCVPVAEWLGKRILEVDRIERDASGSRGVPS